MLGGRQKHNLPNLKSLGPEVVQIMDLVNVLRVVQNALQKKIAMNIIKRGFWIVESL